MSLPIEALQPGPGLAATAMQADPSSTLPLSTPTAQQNLTPDHLQPHPQHHQPDAALPSSSMTFKQESADGAPLGGLAASASAAAAARQAGALGQVPEPGSAGPAAPPPGPEGPPADPNDPEAVAAALGFRISGLGANIIFEKALTASDVSGGGRVVVPKSVAEQYFPKLDQPSGVSISATDLEGRTYTFKWRFWVNNSSRMYLLEGAGELHRNYGLEVGDVMVFAQRPDGSLVVAGRVASKSDVTRKQAVKRPVAATTTSGGGAAAGQGSRGRDARGARAAPRPQPPDAAAAPVFAAAAPAAGRPAGGGSAAVAASPAAATAAAAAGRKRKASVVPAAPSGPAADVRLVRGRGEEGASLAVLDMEAPSDGVFRALVVQQPAAAVALGVALARNNRWTATLDVAGEVYQAFFDTRDDAVEAVTAAGASP